MRRLQWTAQHHEPRAAELAVNVAVVADAGCAGTHDQPIDASGIVLVERAFLTVGITFVAGVVDDEANLRKGLRRRTDVARRCRLDRGARNRPPQTLVSANNLRAAATHDAIEKWKADLVVVEEPASFGSSGGRRAIHRIDLPGRRFERLHVIRHPIDFFRVEVRMNDGVAEQPAGAGIVIDDIAYRRYLSVLENILPGLSR